jgi:hypothetical protein
MGSRVSLERESARQRFSGPVTRRPTRFTSDPSSRRYSNRAANRYRARPGPLAAGNGYLFGPASGTMPAHRVARTVLRSHPPPTTSFWRHPAVVGDRRRSASPRRVSCGRADEGPPPVDLRAEFKTLTAIKTIPEREAELRALLATESGRAELEQLAARYAAAGGSIRPTGRSVITYIIVHERQSGLVRV